LIKLIKRLYRHAIRA